jgi:hypothetical protein
VVLLGEGPKTTFTGNGATDLTSQVVRFQDSDRFLTTLARTLVQKQLATGAR